MPFTPRKRAYLVGVVGLGEERVAKLEQELDAANKTLDAVGVEKKDEAAPEAKPAEPKPETKDEPAWFLADMKPEEFTKLMAAGIQAGLEQTKEAQAAAVKEAIAEFSQSVLAGIAKVALAQAELGGRLAQLEGLTPRGYRATQDAATKTDKAVAAPQDDPRVPYFQQFVAQVAGVPLGPKP